MTELEALDAAFADLDDAEAQRVVRAIGNSRSASTRRSYASRWRGWTAWCAEYGHTPLPGTSFEVAAYVTWLAEKGLSLSTINASLAAIRAVHEDRGLEDPTTGAGMTRVRAGVARSVGVAPSRQAHAITIQELRRMLVTCDPDGVRGVRDRALLLLGFAGALRRSEIAALEVSDVTRQHCGIVLRIRRSKSDQEGRGALVGVPRGEREDTDPVTALHAWMTLAGIHDGRLFLAITRHNSVPRTRRPLSGAAIDAIIQSRAAAAGLSDLPITGHSLRAGHATAAANAGVDALRLARTTRHARLETLARYLRPAEVIGDSSAGALGL